MKYIILADEQGQFVERFDTQEDLIARTPLLVGRLYECSMIEYENSVPVARIMYHPPTGWHYIEFQKSET